MQHYSCPKGIQHYISTLPDKQSIVFLTHKKAMILKFRHVKWGISPQQNFFAKIKNENEATK